MTLSSTYPIRDVQIPASLCELPDPPKQLYVRGTLPDVDVKHIAVVGSRNYTPYAKGMCTTLIQGLKGYPVAIVSGLALGIDGIAHTAALDAGIPTVAIPGSGLDERVLYPATHRPLAHRILKEGGALLSEFPPQWKPRKESFPQRNRIMAGMADAVLVVEATERSGTLITARLAADYNRDVWAVPGPATSPTAKGPHMLIKRGAALIESSADILDALGLNKDAYQATLFTGTLSKDEQTVREVLQAPLARDELVAKLSCPVSEANSLLAACEIKGFIRERLGYVEWIA